MNNLPNLLQIRLANFTELIVNGIAIGSIIVLAGVGLIFTYGSLRL